MSFLTRPFSPLFGSKLTFTVSTSAGTPQSLGKPSGPMQLRIVNYDTGAPVAYAAGPTGTIASMTVAANPTLAASGATEIVTVHPNQDGSELFFNVIGDTGASGGKFEVTRGQGI